VQTPDRANQAGGDCTISALRARDDMSLSSSGYYEYDIATAIESRIGQRDTRLGFRADHCDHPTSNLLQRWLTGE
jgi:hypothetical protein